MYKIVVEILKGWGGGYFSGQQMEIPGRRGGLHEIHSMVGDGYFLALHNNIEICFTNLFNALVLLRLHFTMVIILFQTTKK